jgi:hypothetical protein
MLMSKRNRLGCSMIAALMLPAAALAQAGSKPADAKPAETKPVESKPAADLPSAKSIIEKYVEVTGGRAALEKVKAREIKGKFEVPGVGMSGTMTVVSRQPSFSHMSIDMGAAGKFERGTDGKTAWEVGPMGPRVLDGAELTEFLRSSDMLADLNIEKHYKATTKAMVKVGESDAYQVEMVDLKDEKNVVQHFYDVKSGLLVRRTETQKTQMGDMPAESLFENYKKFGDLMTPVTTRQKIPGMEQLVTVESVAYPETIPDEKFAPPAAVKALLDKEKSKGTQPKKDEPATPKP